MFFLQYYTMIHKCSREQAFFTTFLSSISIVIPFFVFPGDIIFVTFCKFSFTFYWKMKIIAPNLIFLFTLGIYFMNNNRNSTENTFRLLRIMIQGDRIFVTFLQLSPQKCQKPILGFFHAPKFYVLFIRGIFTISWAKRTDSGDIAFNYIDLEVNYIKFLLVFWDKDSCSCI